MSQILPLNEFTDNYKYKRLKNQFSVFSVASAYLFERRLQFFFHSTSLCYEGTNIIQVRTALFKLLLIIILSYSNSVTRLLCICIPFIGSFQLMRKLRSHNLLTLILILVSYLLSPLQACLCIAVIFHLVVSVYKPRL